MNTIKDYRYLPNELVDSSAPASDHHSHHHKRYQRSLFNRLAISEQPTYPTHSLPLSTPSFTRPFGMPLLPRGASYFPPAVFNTTPLFSRPNLINRFPITQPSFWYRPMK
jgi:hypothetical protein